MADGATGTEGTATEGSAGGEEVDSGGGGAPGNGRGRGLPLEAHAAAERAIKTQNAKFKMQTRKVRDNAVEGVAPVILPSDDIVFAFCILNFASGRTHCNRLTPFVTWFLGMRILDTPAGVRHHVEQLWSRRSFSTRRTNL